MKFVSLVHYCSRNVHESLSLFNFEGKKNSKSGKYDSKPVRGMYCPSTAPLSDRGLADEEGIDLSIYSDTLNLK